MYFIGDEELDALKRLFERKRFYRYQASYQSECDLFEKEFSEYAGVPYSLILSSGTNAIMLALLAAGVKPGDEVLVPTYTFVATATAVIQAGAIPVLVDVDKNLSLDLNSAKSKISEKTKAVILVHMDGLVANISETKKFCEGNSLVFIEDVAQAIGARYENKVVGSFGDFGCYSLNENKNISCGEGGIVITRDRVSYEKLFCLHDTPAQFNPTKKDFFKEITPFIGFSMRVSEIQGAIMRVQLGRLSYIMDELKKRKLILKRALADIGGVDVISGYSDGECCSSIHLFFPDQEKANYFGKKLRDNGFLFIPVTTRPAHASWKWNHLLGERSHIQEAVNPYNRTEKNYSYHISNYLQSVDILMKTLKMDIDIHLSYEDTEAAAQKIKKVIVEG